MIQPRFKFLSIYGGIGMGARALTQIGGEEVACIDLGSLQQEIYNAQPFHKDGLYIKIDAKKFTLEILNERLTEKGREPIKPGDIQVILISSPCTYISKLNMYRSPWADTNYLLLETARFLENFECKIPLFIIENVPALCEHNEMRPLFTELKRSIYSLKDYDFNWDVLNSKDYGVGQSRRRFIGAGKLWSLPGEITFPQPTTKDYDDLKLNRIIPTAIGYCPGISRTKIMDENKIKIIGKRNKWFSADRIIGAITASGGEMILDAITGNRPFTIDELKKFFGIEEFNFDGFSDGEIHFVIGNGIAVPFFRCIAEHLVSTLLLQ